MSEAYLPPTIDWVAKQVELYEGSGGTEGTTLLDTGLPCILVTHRGVKSGALRKTPLMTVKVDEGYVLIGSYGGAPKDPTWVANLRANPTLRYAIARKCLSYGPGKSPTQASASASMTPGWRSFRPMRSTRRRRIG